MKQIVFILYIYFINVIDSVLCLYYDSFMFFCHCQIELECIESNLSNSSNWQTCQIEQSSIIAFVICCCCCSKAVIVGFCCHQIKLKLTNQTCWTCQIKLVKLVKLNNVPLLWFVVVVVVAKLSILFFDIIVLIVVVMKKSLQMSCHSQIEICCFVHVTFRFDWWSTSKAPLLKNEVVSK